MLAKLEYIWLDGNKVPRLRSKTKILKDFKEDIKEVPMWSFDGSSTEQAPGHSSDCLLKPVSLVRDYARCTSMMKAGTEQVANTSYLVMCEVLNPDETPHTSNSRATIEDDSDDYWFGFEQEYFLWDPKTNLPLGFPEGFPDRARPLPQGPYYCSVGAANAFGRKIAEAHLDLCLEAGLVIHGINAEVAPGQWEYQIFAKGAKKAGDHAWLARYLLERTAEKHNVSINWHCKPMGNTDWNGSGMHTNFSNNLLRTCGNKEVFQKVCEAFRPVVKEHIEVYGPDNERRLTGKHETAAINQFSYDVSDRGASIRIPVVTVKAGWKGYLEDRRPNSAADPYKVAGRIIKTLKTVEV